MISITDLCFSFGRIPVIQELNLHLKRGEWLVISGASGSGKSTLLRLIAGLERPSEGEIILASRKASSPRQCLAPHLRGIAMVFQNPALYPNLSVEENVAFPLFGQDKDEAMKRSHELLEAIELRTLAPRKPSELSGGEARRVALARALAPRAPILLLDEPLVHLPPELQERMRRLLDRLVAEIGSTVIEVSHEHTSEHNGVRRMRLLAGKLKEQD